MIRNNDELIEFLESFYGKELTETRDYIKKEYKRDHLAWTILNKESSHVSHLIDKAREHRYLNYEFFYERQSKFVISGMRWHEDFARSLYIDLIGEDKLGGFNNVANTALVTEKLYGFMSTVGERKMKHYFRPSSQEMLYIRDYI